MSGGRALPHPFAAWRPAEAPRHFRSRSAFVLKYQAMRRDLAYRRPPRLATGLDGGRILFLGMERLFLSRSPSLCSTRQRC